MPSSNRRMGAAESESGRQNAVCSPEGAPRETEAPEPNPASEPAVYDDGVGADVAGGAAEECACAASCRIAPEPGTVPSTRSKATPGGMDDGAAPGPTYSV